MSNVILGFLNNKYLLLAALFVVVLLLFLLRMRRNAVVRTQKFEKKEYEPRVMVPISLEENAMSKKILSLRERLLNCGDRMSNDIKSLIDERAPFSLNDIITVYNRLPQSLQYSLRNYIADKQMLQGYFDRRDQEEFSAETLIAVYHISPDENLLSQFVELLASRDEAEQMLATRLLSGVHDNKSMTYLALALAQPHRFVPARIAEILASIGEPAAKLLTRLLPEIYGDSRRRVLEALAIIKVPYEIDNIVLCLLDSDATVRAAAVTTLGERGCDNAAQLLRAAVTDEVWQVRAATAKALGKIGDKSALPLVRQLTQDDQWWVSANAKEALNLLQSAGADTNVNR